VNLIHRQIQSLCVPVVRRHIPSLFAPAERSEALSEPIRSPEPVITKEIDTAFDFERDTPSGKDPDAHSPTLRRYHRLLWSKPLPGGHDFRLVETEPNAYLYHSSDLGEYFLASDAITHTYKNTKSMAPVVDQIPEGEMDGFYKTCSTIGAYTVFPGKAINRKMTINQARGVNHRIKDRFDLTLECIRRYYLGNPSPLTDTFLRYDDFFRLFKDFSGYVAFFLLQDLVDENSKAVKFHLPFEDFGTPALPRNVSEYRRYKDNVLRFVDARNQRIEKAFICPG
jgi:hypothetical protein